MAVLGDLEQHVMAVLWRAQRPLSVREVHESLHYARPVAYTTVLTVLDRLAKKDAVTRARDGRAWLYRATKTCVDLHVEEILALLDGCGAGHAEQILAGVRAGLATATVPGQESCLTTGDPAWTPAAVRETPDAAADPTVTPLRPVPGPARSLAVSGGCSFSGACAAAGLDCSQCPAEPRAV